MITESEIEFKYRIVFINKERYYYEDLSEKDYTLECATPYSLEIAGKSFITSSWKQLLIDVCVSCLKDHPDKKQDLLDYYYSWNDTKKPFSEAQGKNYYEVGEGIYLLYNNTATHGCWLLRDILVIFGIDLSKITFIIHRAPLAEPPECRKFYEQKTRNAFRYYYTKLLRRTAEQADRVFKNLDVLNRYMGKCSHAYDNLYLFTNNNTYANYKARLIEYLKNELRLDDKNLVLSHKYLTILGDFYKTVYK